MARTPILTFDRGTLILHPPPRGKAWIDHATWDDRVERFRIPALVYRHLIRSLKTEGTQFEDRAPDYQKLKLIPAMEMTPYPHQHEALHAWKQTGGVVKEPEEVAEMVAVAVEEERFLILTDEIAQTWMNFKNVDLERWLKGMRRMQANMEAASSR